MMTTPREMARWRIGSPHLPSRHCGHTNVIMHVCSATLLSLLNSGLTHNYICEEAICDTSLQLECHDNMKVTVADGERMPCLGVFRGTPFSIDDDAFLANLFALPLASRV